MPTQLKPAASCLLEFSLLGSFQFLQGNTDLLPERSSRSTQQRKTEVGKQSLSWASESFHDSWLCSPWRLHVVFQMSLATFLNNCNKDKTWTKQASSAQTSIHQIARVVWECLLTWKKQWFVENSVTGTSCLFITPRVRFALTSLSYISWSSLSYHHHYHTMITFLLIVLISLPTCPCLLGYF